MPKKCNLDGKFISLLLYVAVAFKKMINDPFSCWFHFDRKQMHQEKSEAIGVVPKHNNSLKTFPYAI